MEVYYAYCYGYDWTLLPEPGVPDDGARFEAWLAKIILHWNREGDRVTSGGHLRRAIHRGDFSENLWWHFYQRCLAAKELDNTAPGRKPFTPQPFNTEDD